MLVVYQIVKHDPAHYWIVVFSTAELYGGCVLFASPFCCRGQSEAMQSWLMDNNEGDDDDWMR